MPEDALLAKIEGEVARLERMDRAIFNLHVPPKDSQLDNAALLNPDLSPVIAGGAPVMAGVGSTAVRAGLRRNVRRLLAKYGYPPDLSEDATQLVLKQAELSTENGSETA